MFIYTENDIEPHKKIYQFIIQSTPQTQHLFDNPVVQKIIILEPVFSAHVLRNFRFLMGVRRDLGGIRELLRKRPEELQAFIF